MPTTRITIERDAKSKQPSVKIKTEELRKLMNFKIKKSEDYSDAEILVYNSMINAARIIAENS
jgi:hypothetical protein